MIVGLTSLATTILVSILGKGILRLIPILCGISVGYVLSLFFGFVDFSPLFTAAWFSMPAFTFPEWNLAAVFYIVPIAIAPAHRAFRRCSGRIRGDRKRLSRGSRHQEHHAWRRCGHQYSLNAGWTSQHHLFRSHRCRSPDQGFQPGNYDLGRHRRHPPGICGQAGALLQTIPSPVMGGIMLLLFGAIMVVGLNTLVKSGDDLMEARNLAIVALILIFGIGGMSFSAGQFQLQGIGLAGILGVFLNLVLPKSR